MWRFTHRENFFIFKAGRTGWRDGSRLVRRTLVQFPACTWQLTTVCNSSSRSDSLISPLRAPGTSVMHMHTHTYTYTHAHPHTNVPTHTVNKARRSFCFGAVHTEVRNISKLGLAVLSLETTLWDHLSFASRHCLHQELLLLVEMVSSVFMSALVKT